MPRVEKRSTELLASSNRPRRPGSGTQLYSQADLGAFTQTHNPPGPKTAQAKTRREGRGSDDSQKSALGPQEGECEDGLTV
eukprot:CAMPEP_0185342184 /NCGR_PEP_ID=MMETSP1363-20130426/98999_1 /TAXON_ID=38817 /ORGANISM="Gephyrocapsa oceanica, Strain RCC1303" /LENGTH=80 /DNA_ID=CAMNT_0027941411 /DNA_START=203 /DNA_END=445 /DNA_ORIENTATION=+